MASRCRVEWAAEQAPAVAHHGVEFYESEAHLADVVARFLGDALRAGAAAIVIATAEHQQSIVHGLEGIVDVAEAIRSGQLRLLDAVQMLDALVHEGAIDEERFREQVGAMIARTRMAWPAATPHVYGEVVDLLCRDGRRDVGVELERMWNRLGTVEDFSLLCGYAMSSFAHGTTAESFDEVCKAHTHVLPTESFLAHGSAENRHLQAARLQQRAHALETELAMRVTTEHALRRARDELAGALRTKDEILAMLGHELRNPLSAILTAVDVVRLKGAESREHLIIERQVRRLHRLVEDLLDVSRLVRGTFDLALAPVDLADVVRCSEEMAGECLQRRRQDLERRVPEALRVVADGERLARAIANLLENAAQRSEPGSRITLAAECRGPDVAITVSDRGGGIAPDLLPRIFEPFVQDAQPIDRPRGGLGIGLAIARNIVELHGGTITAHSEGVGRGSEFVVTIPLRATVAVAASPRSCA